MGSPFIPISGSVRFSHQARGVIVIRERWPDGWPS